MPKFATMEVNLNTTVHKSLQVTICEWHQYLIWYKWIFKFLLFKKNLAIMLM
jgi:hypothetical protein